MENILIIGEIEKKEVKKSTKELITLANQLVSESGAKIEICLIGDNSSSFADSIQGVHHLYHCDTDSLDMDSYFTTIEKLVNEKKYSNFLFSHSNQGKNLSAKLAAKLNCGVIADVVSLTSNGTDIIAKKPVYSGKAYAKIKILSETKIFTVRSNSIEIKKFEQTPQSESIKFQPQSKVEILNQELSTEKKIELTDASIIISGGRGIKDPKNWNILQELVDVLGGALGASRSAVDAGWIEHSHQIGQTGKTVSPNCYIACGISGAIQHLAGMGSSKCIVAINTEKNAPIFKVANYGIVGDLFEIVPEITKECKKILG